ncbi:sensor histidine kinase [Actinocorallia sp. A-T 12471]|uniref:sensor histidine kinase n=1 Tax=Actinocorallia sp. A-T 12471 TaxID=3089813 RepID=UPI0029D0E65C|nr:histidine kinase [Actinocorallia sp. A-T 12471]MDX6738915.1 histidine kinase [Actinocorallia sp. A-T 12471]
MCVWPALIGEPVTYEGAFSVGVLLGGALLVRRRFPVAVLVFSGLVLLGFRTAELYGGGWLWPFSAALVGAALAGRLGWAVGVGLFVLAYGVGGEAHLFGADGGAVIARVGTEALWLGLLLSGATAWRQYTRWRAEHEARLTQVELTRLAEQRLEIAREVHDVVAHTLAVVGVHLSVAADALTDDPDGPGVDLPAARDALGTAATARRAAMADLRTFVGELRGAPRGGVADIGTLLAAARAGGLAVEIVREGDLEAVPAAQGLLAYRVVREAVTNALRHSGAAHLTVRLTADGGALRVTVSDDGSASSPVVPGHGLTGMRERVTALGGTLEWQSHDGFTLHATLPCPVEGSPA